MQVLKAYANADATYGQNFKGDPRNTEFVEHDGGSKVHPVASGDRISLSDEAIELLQRNQESMSICPQDATYDQYGNMTRQFANLQNDLRRIALQFMSTGDGLDVAARLGAVQAQLTSIQAVI